MQAALEDIINKDLQVLAPDMQKQVVAVVGRDNAARSYCRLSLIGCSRILGMLVPW